jgi:hypothetical protein
MEDNIEHMESCGGAPVCDACFHHDYILCNVCKGADNRCQTCKGLGYRLRDEIL